MKTQANKHWEDKPSQAVGALIICPKTGRALLQLRGKDSDTPLTWGTFGGGVDEGENIRQALFREIEEECDYTGSIELIPLHKFVSDDDGFEYYTYIGLVPEEFSPVTNHETENYKWFAADRRDAYPTPLHPELKKLLDKPSRWNKVIHYSSDSTRLNAFPLLLRKHPILPDLEDSTPWPDPEENEEATKEHLEDPTCKFWRKIEGLKIYRLKTPEVTILLGVDGKYTKYVLEYRIEKLPKIGRCLFTKFVWRDKADSRMKGFPQKVVDIILDEVGAIGTDASQTESGQGMWLKLISSNLRRRGREIGIYNMRTKELKLIKFPQELQEAIDPALIKEVWGPTIAYKDLRVIIRKT